MVSLIIMCVSPFKHTITALSSVFFQSIDFWIRLLHNHLLRVYKYVREERRSETVCLAELRFRTINAVDVDVMNLTLFDVSFGTLNVCQLHKNQS